MTEGGGPSRCTAFASKGDRHRPYSCRRAPKGTSVGVQWVSGTSCWVTTALGPTFAPLFCKLCAGPAMTQSCSWPSAAVTLWFGAPSGTCPTTPSGRHRWCTCPRGGCTGSAAGCSSVTRGPGGATSGPCCSARRELGPATSCSRARSTFRGGLAGLRPAVQGLPVRVPDGPTGQAEPL
ncbi:hypothetical protein AAFF_G00340210 [Aldrovandia affinis]|uniref:Uncharacterized protein n=1 Tax=Aldrovandia affinis TaxID=143900 RepID=A0AAD7WPI9_9TELE|nr:hypothetical protein AAFF_G00340210 [Aldrovandia affinis]